MQKQSQPTEWVKRANSTIMYILARDTGKGIMWEVTEWNMTHSSERRSLGMEKRSSALMVIPAGRVVNISFPEMFPITKID